MTALARPLARPVSFSTGWRRRALRWATQALVFAGVVKGGLVGGALLGASVAMLLG